MSCLAEEDVLAYLERSLSPEDRLRVEEHVDECPECRGLLADLVRHSVVEPAAAPANLTELGGAALLPPGCMVDHFQVVRLLGRGGMGEVYLARDIKLGRKVAVKLIRPEWAPSRHALERFLLEARTTARFNHPHIVTIYAVGEHQGLPYLALEYLAGRTLRQRMDEEPIRLREAMRVALAIAQAVEELHRHGVLHGDLKPSNVLIPRDGRLRVVDFGLAGTLTRPEVSASVEMSTQLGPPPEPVPSLAERALQGTPLYMAPEQWRAEPRSEATDLWALGVILFELIGGRLPYSEPAPESLRTRVLDAEPVPRLLPRETAPEELLRLVAACLEKDPARRPSASEVIRLLSSLLALGFAAREGEEVCPFRGLLPFSEAEAALFFGREAEVGAFLERLRDNPVLPVVGPSGAGKSSFVQAGLVPRLREQGWRVIRLRPGSRPFHALAGQLLAPSSTGPGSSASGRGGRGGPGGGEQSAIREQLAAELQASPARLGWLLLQRIEQEGGRLLLFVDQLEEVYTLVEEEPVRRAFMEALCLASDDPRDGVRVIFTLRDDCLGRLARGPEVQDALRQVTVIHSPEASVLKETLVRPLDAVGYTFDDPAIVDEMVSAVSGEPACLALLQFTVQLLWERRDTHQRRLTRESYRMMGGVGGALAWHADGLLGSLSPAEVRLARGLLLRLVTPEGTRRLVGRGSLLEGMGPGAPEVLDRLTRGRLVTVRKGEGEVEAEVELVHESLLSAWATLRRWVDESREDLSFLAEVEQAAELWERRGRHAEELWSGEALAQALRARQHVQEQLPPRVEHFLGEAKTREHLRVRGRRLRAAAATLLLGLLALASTAVAVIVSRQKHAVTDEKERAVAQRSEALRESARAAMLRGELLEARAKLRPALEAGDSLLGRALWWQLQRQPQLSKRDLGANIYDVAFSPDGKTVAAASQGEAVHLLRVPTLEGRALEAPGAQVLSVAFAPDGHRLAGGCIDGSIRLWDLDAGSVRVLHGHGAAVWRLAFARDGKRLASASWDKTVRLWDLDRAEGSARVLPGQAQVYAVAFSPDGRRLASAGADRQIHLWSSGGEHQRALEGHSERIYSLGFSPDSRELASGSADRTVRLWSLDGEPRARVLAGHTGGVYGVAFSPDGRELASSSWDGTMRVWSRARGTSRVLGEHEAGLYAVAYSPRGTLLASGSADKTVRLWEARAEARREPRVGHTWEAWSIAFRPDGKRLASSGRDRTIRLWDVQTGDELKVLRGHEALVTGLAYSPDGRRLASGGSDKTIRIWSPETGLELHTLVGHTASVRGLAFSDDGKWLASTSADRTVRIWDATRATLVHTLEGHTAPTMEASFSPDGGLLASSSGDGTVRLWDPRTGALRRVLEGHQAGVFGVGFTPDGRRLVTSGDDHTVRIWDLAGREPGRVIGRHTSRLHFLAVHPGGQRVAVATADGSVRVWDLASGGSVSWDGHRAEVNYVRFSPDGRLAASCSDDGTVRTWRVDQGVPLWRAPLLLGGGAVLFSHRGVSRLPGGALPSVPGPSPRARWQERALEALLASASADRKLLCLKSPDGRIALWDLTADRQLHEEVDPEVRGVLATRAGCLTQRQHEVRFYDRRGAYKTVAAGATAMAPDDGGALVAAGDRVLRLDEHGRPRSQLPVKVEATSLARVGEWVVVGLRSGELELVSLVDRVRGRRPAFSHEGAPASPVTILREGLPGTVVAGHANGVVVVWSLGDGLQLLREELHGAVRHVLVEDRWLHVASELGDHRSLDLAPLRLDYCALLRRIWSSVPVTWERGFPIERPPPAGHPCLRRTRPS